VAYVVLLVVLFLVVFVISAPLLRPRAADPGAEPSTPGGSEVRELEAARDAKYREIRDAELDHQTGKLSDADFESIDRTLRAEAIAILRKLDAARGT
jgi:flagellar biosynthesis/type III secretory pathway M-ring protein FliF/YscJ